VTKDLFVTAAALYSGTPGQKATTVAHMIKTFGVDVAMLDSLLAGEVPAGGGGGGTNISQEINAAVSRAMAPVLQSQQQQGQQLQQEVSKELDTFAADPKNEFFDDVKDTMADLMELAVKNGKQLDLQSAYNRAILLHDDISKVVQERTSKAKSAVVAQAAAAAKKKAVSIVGAPAKGVAESSGASLRSDIEAALSDLDT
jgi:hypothetical protein